MDYIVLPSNSSLEKYPENNGGSYTVDLPQTLHLSPQWKVGLAEIMFNEDWPTVSREDIWVRRDMVKLSPTERYQTKSSKAWKTEVWPQVFKDRDLEKMFIYAYGTTEITFSFKTYFEAGKVYSISEFLKAWTELCTAAQGDENTRSNGLYWNFKGAHLAWDEDMLNWTTPTRELLSFIAYLVGENQKTDSFLSKWPYYPADINISGREYVIGEAEYMEEKDEIVYPNNTDFITKVVSPLIKKAMGIDGSVSDDALTVSEKKSADNMKHTELSITKYQSVGWRLEFSPMLYRILGYDSSQLHEQRFLLPKPNSRHEEKSELSKITSKYEIDINRGMSSLWVYTNIAASHIVGSGKTPLLRVVGIKNEASKNRGKTNLITFTHPHFYRLSEHDISSIQIKIYNIFGAAPVKFYSPVICVLKLIQDDSNVYINPRKRGGEDNNDQLAKRARL